jgi:hypothetical protein
MAEEIIDTGFIPGRSYSPEEYALGRPDFYKDYLGTTGIKSTVRDDDDDKDDDKKQEVATVLSATGVSQGDSDTINLLSTQLGTKPDGSLQAMGNYYDTKVSAVDLQSMDLSAKSWDDYKKSKGIGDKSDFKRNLLVTTGGLSTAGFPGALVGSALFGKDYETPWGTENVGGGMFTPIGNLAMSEKMAASKEVQAALGAFNISDLPADHPQRKEVAGQAGQDTGYAIRVDGTYLVRRPGNGNYIGTLPMGITNQQVLNLEAIQKGFLPSSFGISNEEGFGVGGEGGYRADGSFVDPNGQTSYYGSMKGLQQLADKEFGGNRDLAKQWVDEVRKGRTMFTSSGTSIEEGKKIMNRIQSQILTPKPRPVDEDAIKIKTTPTIGSGEFRDADVIFPAYSADEAYISRSNTGRPMDLYNPRTGLYESEIDYEDIPITEDTIQRNLGREIGYRGGVNYLDREAAINFNTPRNLTGTDKLGGYRFSERFDSDVYSEGDLNIRNLPPITTPTTARVTRTRLPDVLSPVASNLVGGGADLAAGKTFQTSGYGNQPAGTVYTTITKPENRQKVAEFASLPDPFFQDSDDDEGDSFDDYESPSGYEDFGDVT